METDLAILCPDGAWPQALGAILSRSQSLGIRPVSVKFIPDPLRDSSPQAVELLRPFLTSAGRALVVRDFAGSGWESRGVAELAGALRTELERNGWVPERVAVLIAEPEIESWLRLASAHLHSLLQDRARRNREDIPGWNGKLEEALRIHGGLDANGKAVAPKEVFRYLLRHYGIPPSNALFEYLGNRESLSGCVVPSFVRFLEIMRRWFPKA